MRSVLAAVGGVRGIVETTLPGLGFIILYTVTTQVVISLIAPVGLGVIFLAARLIQRSAVTPVIAGLVSIALSAALVLFSGRGQDYFVAGFWTNALYGGVLLISVLAGWPIIGLIVGVIVGDGVQWKRRPTTYRGLQALTLLWVAMFGARLAVQLPLYFAGNVEALGVARLAMGLPLYAPVLILTWLVARALFPSGDAGSGDTEATREEQ